MEFLRRTISHIQKQLSVLTLSQRFAIFLCLVIMFGAIYWMVKYSSQQTMTPLLDQPFSTDEIQRISEQLDTWQQKYDVRGDRVLVPSADLRRVIGRLGYAKLLPDDTSLGFSFLLEETGGIFMPESQRATQNLIIRQIELARCIEEFPGIESATVFINPAGKRRLSNSTPMASASVHVTTSPGAEANNNLGNTIADFISDANNNMKRENVTVVANGQILKITAEGQQNPATYLELKTSLERYYQNKVIGVLEVINAMVQVDVTPQLDETEEVLVTIPDEESGSWLPIVSQTSSEQSSSDGPAAGEPGIAANVSSGGGGGMNRSETNEQNETSRQAIAGSQTVRTRKAVGGVTDMTVTVSYPKSFFKLIAKEKATDKTAEPTEQEVQAQIDLESPELRRKVMGAIGLKTDEPENEARVVISTYWDLDPVMAGVAGMGGGADLAGQGSVGSIGNLARGYGKQVAVSVLALMSLFMVLMMVKRAGGPIDLEEAEAEALMAPAKKPLDVMSPEESNFAEAEDAGGLLAGMELDEHAVQSQQMLEQIRSMVHDAPDKVANLLGKWIAEGD